MGAYIEGETVGDQPGVTTDTGPMAMVPRWVMEAASPEAVTLYAWLSLGQNTTHAELEERTRLAGADYATAFVDLEAMGAVRYDEHDKQRMYLVLVMPAVDEERRAEKAAREAARAFVEAAGPIWAWGDGCGAEALSYITEAVHELGYEPPKALKGKR